jgi:hypothetical protein
VRAKDILDLAAHVIRRVDQQLIRTARRRLARCVGSFAVPNLCNRTHEIDLLVQLVGRERGVVAQRFELLRQRIGDNRASALLNDSRLLIRRVAHDDNFARRVDVGVRHQRAILWRHAAGDGKTRVALELLQLLLHVVDHHERRDCRKALGALRRRLEREDRHLLCQLRLAAVVVRRHHERRLIDHVVGLLGRRRH